MASRKMEKHNASKKIALPKAARISAYMQNGAYELRRYGAETG
jgi:hypothetical protein